MTELDAPKVSGSTYLTVKQACLEYAPIVNRDWLYRVLADASIDAVKRGGRTYVVRASLEGYLRNLPMYEPRRRNNV